MFKYKFHAVNAALFIAIFPAGALAQCVETEFVREVIGEGENGIVPGELIPKVLECNGSFSDPIVAGPTIAQIKVLEPSEVVTQVDAFDLVTQPADLSILGRVVSGGTAIVADELSIIEAPGRITAQEDGIRLSGDNFDLRNLGSITAGGTAINLGASSDGHVRVKELVAGQYGLIGGDDIQVVVGHTDNNVQSFSKSGKDTIRLGQDATVYVFSDGSTHEVRATGEHASVVSIENGHVITFGDHTRLVSENGAAIKFRGGVGTRSTVSVEGTIRGRIGIDASEAGESNQVVSVIADVIGTGGVAIDLGDGFDEVVLGGLNGHSPMITGDVLLGGGWDLLAFYQDKVSVSDHHQSFSFRPTGPIMSDGSVFDGGDGVDLVDFQTISTMSIVSAVLNAPSDGTLTLDFAGVVLSNRFVNFENFQFTDKVLGASDLVAPVPLPASALLLMGGLIGLRAAARRG